MHQAALKELATSFDADVAPLLVEVEGQQRKLTGPAETQFVAWRELLRQVLSLETGLPTDPNDVVVAAVRPRRLTDAPALTTGHEENTGRSSPSVSAGRLLAFASLFAAGVAVFGLLPALDQ